MYLPFRNKIDSILKISDENWELLESIIESKKISKNEYLLREGEISHGVFLVTKGLLRTFYLNHSGKEISSSFYFENDFLQELESLSSGKPSTKNIQALEDSIVFYIPKKKLITLYEESNFFLIVGQMILEQISIGEQKHSSLIASHLPKDRYLYVIKNNPELVQRIPLQYLATYLGMSRESLSRIRKRV